MSKLMPIFSHFSVQRLKPGIYYQKMLELQTILRKVYIRIYDMLVYRLFFLHLYIVCSLYIPTWVYNLY